MLTLTLTPLHHALALIHLKSHDTTLAQLVLINYQYLCLYLVLMLIHLHGTRATHRPKRSRCVGAGWSSPSTFRSALPAFSGASQPAATLISQVDKILNTTRLFSSLSLRFSVEVKFEKPLARNARSCSCSAPAPAHISAYRLSACRAGVGHYRDWLRKSW